jgi:hypothetical protein
MVGGEEVTPYYDPHYRCEMEILRFDSDHPNESYEHAIQRCQHSLAHMPVLTPERAEVAIPVMAPLVVPAMA